MRLKNVVLLVSGLAALEVFFSNWLFRVSAVKISTQELHWLNLDIRYTAIFVVIIAVVLAVRMSNVQRIGWILLASGALANGVNAWWHGGALDYLPFGVWYVNAADLMICLSIPLLAAAMYIEHEQKNNQKKTTH